jgi:O-antigen biosynthesis protein
MRPDGVHRSPSGAGPTCTVVVCTRDRPQLLERCLEALSRQDYRRMDVLVVDNAPSDQRTRGVAERHGVRYLLEPVVGLSRARNLGARSCAAEIVAFLDDDAVPAPSWLGALVREFDDTSVMAVAGQIQALDEDTERNRRYARLSGALLGGAQRLVFDRQTHAWFELANFGAIGSGANMAFRCSAFDVWPGFDQRLGSGARLAGGEESYAFFSLIDRGHRVVYTPDAKVRHPFPLTPLTDDALRARYLKDQSVAVAYVIFLFWEQPRYRGVIVRYLIEALRGEPRTWRVPPPDLTHSVAPRWRAWLARLCGVALYLRSRFA